MTAVNDSGLSHGTTGSPQKSLEENTYADKVQDNEHSLLQNEVKPQYRPSPKHVPGHNWGSENPIVSQEEGQRLLDSGYREGKQIYNITSQGIMVKFQPDNTPENGFHAYEVTQFRDIPIPVLKQMRNDGLISRNDYNKFRKGKK